MELTGKTTRETNKVDGNLRITHEVVHEDGKLVWVRLRIQDITTMSDVGNGYYNANMNATNLNYSRMEAIAAEQRLTIAAEFIELVNSELENVTE